MKFNNSSNGNKCKRATIRFNSIYSSNGEQVYRLRIIQLLFCILLYENIFLWRNEKWEMFIFIIIIVISLLVILFASTVFNNGEENFILEEYNSIVLKRDLLVFQYHINCINNSFSLIGSKGAEWYQIILKK